MMHNPRGGQYYLNRRRRRYRRNPGRGGGGGTNWLLIGGLAAGAFFLLPRLTSGGGLTTLFGGGPATVPSGYTPIGQGLYRAPNGAVVARHPQTGQMIMAPSGSQPTSAEDLLVRAGISLIPSVANNLASWVSSMFSTQQTATGAVTTLPPLPAVSGPYEEWGGAMPGEGSIFGGGEGGAVPDLPPLPSGWYEPWDAVAPSEDWIFAAELPPVTDLPTYPIYSYDYYEYGDPGMYDLPDVPPVDWDVMIGVGSGEVTIANPDEWWGYMGLGRHRQRSLRVTPPVY